MATERLHLRDSFLLDFTANVVRSDSFAGRPSIVLDRSAFYAEAGGQQSDRGTLVMNDREVRVVDVQLTDDGEVHHILEREESWNSGATVRGRIDRAWRTEQMSQHTAQHMLSRAFHDRFGYETISARLGSEISTIDLTAPSLSQEQVNAIEDVVNAAVLDDREIRILFPTAEELARLPLVSAPKVDKDIRVIEVDGFDAMPCGGTHCARTGQVGPVRILGQEKYKGLTRLTFIAGKRALDRARADDELLRALSATLTCARTELVTVAERTRSDVKTLSQALGSTRAELMGFVASQLLASHSVDSSGSTLVPIVRESADIETLRALAAALTKRPDVIALAATKDTSSGDWLVVAERGASSRFDAGRWFKSATQTHGGRGGGRPEHAEGRFPSAVAWETLVASVRHSVT
jgi:alanyl-tRNA synthetase